MNTQDDTPCAICNDTGWRSITRGKEREVVRCECRLKSRGERLLAAAKIPPRYEHCDLGTFQCDPDDNDQHSLAKAKLYAGRFVEEYPTEKTGLLFVGSVGVGKTHLAVGILKALIRDKGVPCLVLRLSRAAEVDPEFVQRVGAGDGDGNPAAGLRRRGAGA